MLSVIVKEKTMKQRLFVILGATLLLAASAATQPTSAQAAQIATKYPTKGIVVIVGYEPGSGSDTTTRAFMPFVSKILGQPITILNQPGAGGALSWNTLARAKPDGYTLGFAGLPSIFNAAVLAKVEYDPLNSFVWLGVIVHDPVALTVKAGGRYKTLDDFVAAARKNPGKVTIGATGRGSIDHTIGLSIEKAKGVKFNIVNFDGTPQGVTAVLGENLDAMGMNANASMPYEKAGQLKTLAVGGDKPFPGLPNAPTFKSLGVDLYAQAVYRSYIVPKGVPADIYDALVKAFKAASDDPQWKAQAEKMGLPLLYVSPKETTTLAKQLNDAAKVYLAR
jgi:tripartite-type tricarboxylate transporter receptor subunit TctC